MSGGRQQIPSPIPNQRQTEVCSGKQKTQTNLYPTWNMMVMLLHALWARISNIIYCHYIRRVPVQTGERVASTSVRPVFARIQVNRPVKLFAIKHIKMSSLQPPAQHMRASPITGTTATCYIVYFTPERATRDVPIVSKVNCGCNKRRLKCGACVECVELIRRLPAIRLERNKNHHPQRCVPNTRTVTLHMCCHFDMCKMLRSECV